MNKKQSDRQSAFEEWLTSKRLHSIGNYLRALRNPADYVKRFGDREGIPPSKRVPRRLLPTASMYEFFKPNQLRELFNKSKGRKGREVVGIGDNGYFYAALIHYIKWLRENYPKFWENEPEWYHRKAKGQTLCSASAGKTRQQIQSRYSQRCQLRNRPEKSRGVGYVYILTNPSLKGMVKIGRTKRPVNVRSKDLYTTALPTPPEEYISLKTSKYVQVEDLVHRILTKLTRSRVNMKREFFKIKPEEAYEVLRDVSIVLDPDDRCFCRQGKETPIIKPRRMHKTASRPSARPSVKRHRIKGVMTWDGKSKTQLARLIAQREGKPKSCGHLLAYFGDPGNKSRRPCPKDSCWRKPLEDAGVKFDKNDYVSNWKRAKNPL